MAFASSGALAQEIYQYHMDEARKKLDWTWKDEYAELVPQEAAKDYFIHMMRQVAVLLRRNGIGLNRS